MALERKNLPDLQIGSTFKLMNKIEFIFIKLNKFKFTNFKNLKDNVKAN